MLRLLLGRPPISLSFGSQYINSKALVPGAPVSRSSGAHFFFKGLNNLNFRSPLSPHLLAMSGVEESGKSAIMVETGRACMASMEGR